ncbi:MAG: GPP34 family phosphoprotein [Bacteroidales bacterium]
MKNVKLPHRLLIMHYSKHNTPAGENRNIRRALAEAVLHEAAIMKKIRIDENETLHADAETGTGHSIIDTVADRVRMQPGLSLGKWIKTLAANDHISLHVTQNLMDNRLLKASTSGGLFRKKQTRYTLTPEDIGQHMRNYLTDKNNTGNKDPRNEISRSLIAKYEL